MIGPWARFRQIRGFSEERDSAPYSEFQTGSCLVSALNNLQINGRLLVYGKEFRIGKVSDLLTGFAGTAFAKFLNFGSAVFLLLFDN